MGSILNKLLVVVLMVTLKGCALVPALVQAKNEQDQKQRLEKIQKEHEKQQQERQSQRLAHEKLVQDRTEEFKKKREDDLRKIKEKENARILKNVLPRVSRIIHKAHFSANRVVEVESVILRTENVTCTYTKDFSGLSPAVDIHKKLSITRPGDLNHETAKRLQSSLRGCLSTAINSKVAEKNYCKSQNKIIRNWASTLKSNAAEKGYVVSMKVSGRCGEHLSIRVPDFNTKHELRTLGKTLLEEEDGRLWIKEIKISNGKGKNVQFKFERTLADISFNFHWGLLGI